MIFSNPYPRVPNIDVGLNSRVGQKFLEIHLHFLLGVGRKILDPNKSAENKSWKLKRKLPKCICFRVGYFLLGENCV